MAKGPIATINTPGSPKPKAAPKAKRVRIKGRLLSPQKTRQRAQRIHANAMQRREDALNGPASPAAPHAPSALDRQVTSAVNLKYGPQQQQLVQQAISIPSWFKEYQDQLKASQAQQAAFNAGVQHGIDQRVAADTGPGGSPEADQAAASRRALLGSFGNTLGAQAVSQNAFSGNLQDIGRLQQIGAVQANQQAQRQLASDRGDYANTTRQTLREQAHKDRLENAAFGLNEQKANQTAANNRANRRIAKQKLGLDKKKFGLDKNKDAYQRDHKLGPYKPATPKGGSGGTGGGFTPTQVHKAKQTFRSALSWAKSHHPKPGDGADLVTALQAPKGHRKGATLHDPTTGKPLYNPDGTPKTAPDQQGGFNISDPLLAHAVALTAIYGGVDEKTRKAVHKNYGIWLRLSKPGKPYVRTGSGRNKGERPT